MYTVRMRGSVCILYGLGEGPAIGKQLVHKLEQNGLTVTSDASQADYIIAHSGGVLFIPTTYKAKIFLFVGVNNKIEGSVFRTQYIKVKLDFAHAVQSKLIWYWLKKSLWNLFYILRHFHKTQHMWSIAHDDLWINPDYYVKLLQATSSSR